MYVSTACLSDFLVGSGIEISSQALLSEGVRVGNCSEGGRGGGGRKGSVCSARILANS